jgi:pyruvate dehydrogenase E2 component (dihydrolipoamide acetyltransferase)
MIKELKLPNLGENITSAEVLKVLVAVGDKLEKEQSVVEISSDKATLEVPSDISGIVKEINVKEGDSITEGQTVLKVETEGEGAAEKPEAESEEVKAKEAPQPEAKKEEVPAEAKKEDAPKAEIKKEPAKKGIAQFILPNLGENISEAEILKVLVAVGDKLEKEQSVVEISSDKATLEVPSDISGVIKEINVKEGDSVKEGQVILTLETGGEEDTAGEEKPAEKAKAPAQPEKKQEETKSEEKPKQEAVKKEEQPLPERPAVIAPAAPSVRRFAREIGVDINKVAGTGPDGRISVEDVKAYSRELNKTGRAVSPGGAGQYSEALPDFSKWGEVSREAMNNIRVKTAQHLGYAWANVVHVTNFEKADITELEKLRKEYGKKVEAAGGKLTMTAILLKILASALRNFPKFNASIDLEKKEIIYKKYVHLGLAVDTDRGLLVPVIRDADHKNVTQISIEVGQLAEKARNRKLTLDEMQGATFTISNLGGIGGVGFTPIVNSPEVAILGVSKSSFEPVYIDEKFEPRLMMPFSLSYDHRLIDGADAARFMKWVKEAIENPFLLMLEG